MLNSNPVELQDRDEKKLWGQCLFPILLVAENLCFRRLHISTLFTGQNVLL